MPIIPVRQSGKVDSQWRQILQASRVDTAVNVGCTPAATQAIAATYGLDHVDVGDVSNGQFPEVLHWSAVAPEGFRPYAARAGAPLWEMVSAGDPEEPGDAPSLIPVLSGPNEESTGYAAMRGETVLDVSLGGYQEYETAGEIDGPALIWLTQPNNLLSCLWFWNLRALRSLSFNKSPMVILPTTYRQWTAGLKENIGALLRRPCEGNVDVAIRAYKLGGTEPADLAQYLGLEELKDERPRYVMKIGGSTSLRTPPYRYSAQLDPRDWLLFERRAGYARSVRIQRFSPRSTVDVDLPSLREAIPGLGGYPGYIRLRGGYLDRLPTTAKVAELLTPGGTWHGDELQRRFVTSYRAELVISSPPPEAVLAALCTELPAEATVNDKGKLAAALLAVRACSVLIEPNVLAIIDGLRTPRSTGLLKQLKEFAPESPEEDLVEIARQLGGRSDRKYGPLSTLGGFRLLAAAERAVSEGLADRGAEVRCARCMVKSFVPLRATTAQANCPACGAAGAYTATKGLDVMYRLDALVDRASDQGVIPHLATLMALRASYGEADLHLGLDLVWHDGVKSEIDLFGYIGRDVVGGEVKTSPGDFTHAQVARDVDLSDRLGVRTHIMAATAGPIPDEVVRDVATLCRGKDLRLTVIDADPTASLRVRSVVT